MSFWQPMQTNQTMSESITSNHTHHPHSNSSIAKPSIIKSKSTKDLACAFMFRGCNNGNKCQNKYGHPKPRENKKNYWCQYGDACDFNKNGRCYFEHDYAWPKGHAPVEYECQFHTQSTRGCKSTADTCWMYHPQQNDHEEEEGKEGAGLGTTYDPPQDIENDEDDLKQKYEELLLSHRSLQHDHKELEEKYNKLKREVRANKDYKLWDAEDVADWIVQLDYERYGKYKEDLMRNMNNEEVNGSCLDSLDRDGLHRLGISNFKDKIDILNKIQTLVKQNESHTLE